MKRVRKPRTEKQKAANREAMRRRYYRLTTEQKEERKVRQRVYYARYLERHPHYLKDRWAKVRADPAEYQNRLIYQNLYRVGIYPPSCGVYFVLRLRTPLPTIEETILW